MRAVPCVARITLCFNFHALTMHACSAEPGRTTAYSPDIGWRVVWQRIGMEYTYQQIGRRLQIAPSTAHRIFSRFKDTGDVAPREQPSRERLQNLDNDHKLLIMAIVCENPCLYLREICQLIYEATSVIVSGSTVCRTLRRLGCYTRKKVQQIARQRCQEFRGAFLTQVLQYPRDFFVWVDETGCDLAASNIIILNCINLHMMDVLLKIV